MSGMHAALIEKAKAWLWRRGCALVITDMTHGGPETADVIGWNRSYSEVIECKATRADFLADAKKCFRREPERGMGFHRWFCTLPGVIRRVEELPEGWGWLELNARGLRVMRQSGIFEHYDGARQEISLLLSAIRRIGQSAPEGVNVKFYTKEFYEGQAEPQCRASMGVVLQEEQPETLCNFPKPS